jgi:plastocyanin
MRRTAAAGAVLLASVVLAAPASAESVFVTMGTKSFTPRQLDVLVGDNIVWRNTSIKTHNVKFETEGFNSGRLAPRLAANHIFALAGEYAYICTIHDGMTGELGVHPLLLSGPTGPVARGETVKLHVRAPLDATGITIEEDAGAGWVQVATAGPPPPSGHDGHIAPGTLHADVVPPGSASYRAVSALGASQPVRVEVTDGTRLAVAARRARRGRSVVRVSALPAAPGTRVVLQLHLRERFGWWPVARARLDRRSRAAFTVRGHRGAPARAVLVGEDWTTPVSRSPVVRLPRGR